MFNLISISPRASVFDPWFSVLSPQSSAYRYFNNNDIDEPTLCQPGNCKMFVQADLLLFRYLCNIDTIAMREGMQECRHFGIVWIVVNSFGFKSVLFDSTTYIYNWIPLDCFWFCWMYYPREVGWHWQFRQRAQNGHPPLPRSPSGQTGRLPAWKSSSKEKKKTGLNDKTTNKPGSNRASDTGWFFLTENDQNWPKPSN